uniref:BTB domain-containing protein n=1 Tax=Esox lucius TaxID=8010 RepID=A0AAY5JZ09_ESOLU
MDVSNHSLFLLQQLNVQREFGFLCDCTVAIGNVYFKAHRAVLAAFSNYFKMIFIHQSRFGPHRTTVIVYSPIDCRLLLRTPRSCPRYFSILFFYRRKRQFLTATVDMVGLSSFRISRTYNQNILLYLCILLCIASI